MRVRGWLRRQIASEIVVHTTDDSTIRGFLEEVGTDGLVLRAARFLEGETDVALAGEVFIPRPKIAFAQLRPTGDAS